MEDAATHNNYAVLLADLGRQNEAEDHYKKALDLDPENAAAHNNYANLLKGNDRQTEAEDHYKKALDLDPKYATAHNNYANLLTDMGRRTEAEDHYKKALDLNPKDAATHNNYANLLKGGDRQTEAEDHYKKALDLDPKYAAAHNNYANLMRIQNRFSEAESKVRTALQLDPANPYSLSTLGDILADEEFFEEADEMYKDALKNSDLMDKSALSEVHNNLGYVYFQLQKNKKAKKEFQQSIKLSDNVKAIRNLRAIKKAKTKDADLKVGIPKYQKCFLVFVILLLLGFCYYLFLFWTIDGETRLLSDTMFVVQSSILVGLLTVVLFAHQLSRLKVGPQGVELEMSAEYRIVEAKSLSTEAAPKLELC
jgi:Tfp pilus assembly protein PilF